MNRAALSTLLFALLFVTACKTFEQGRPATAPQSDSTTEAKHFIKDQKYTEALVSLEAALRDAQHSSDAPEIKYLIATVYVAADNPQRDYAQALIEFDEFLHNYPDHERAPEARSWRQAIKTILDTKKENERLHKNIEGLKQLDMRQEQKRQGK